MEQFAVIGHGLSPQGKGWGSKINACDIVVRLLNYHWQDIPDYGTKYDYGFYEISRTEMARFYNHNVRTPARGWFATKLYVNVVRKQYFGELPPNSTVIDSTPWEKEGIRLGGMGTKGRLTLTRGVRAALSVLERMPKGQRLVLVGFDNVQARTGLTIEQGYPAAYVACPAVFPFRDYKGGTTKYGNHDYAVEAPLLKVYAKRAGIELVYAGEIW